MAAVHSSAFEDPNLGSGPADDEISLLEESDSGSLLSDDSVLPDYEQEDRKKGTANTLYEACVQNDTEALKRVLERSVTRDEVMEVDINGWVRYYKILQISIKEHETECLITEQLE